MSADRAHCEQIKGFHPLFHTFNKSTRSKAERGTWVDALKQDLWDVVSKHTVALFKSSLTKVFQGNGFRSFDGRSDSHNTRKW